MSRMYYWALSLTAAVAGGSIAVEKFSFATDHAIWIAFGLSIGATVAALGALAIGLARQNYPLSGLSATTAFVAAWNVIASRTLTGSTALWVVFAGGIAVMLLSLRALAIHEAIVERVVHGLEVSESESGDTAIHATLSASPPSSSDSTEPAQFAQGRFAIPASMRSWLAWLTHTGVGVSGAFLVLATYAWSNPTAGVDLRWLALGLGSAATAAALVSLVGQLLPAADGESHARSGLIAQSADVLVTLASGAIAGALVTAMVVMHYDANARWTAFGIGCGMVGAALLGAVVHELSVERVRHELEVRHSVSAVESAR
jgi:hypothetical protein